MAQTKRNYIDSHWLVFVFQGAIALLFGCFTLFTSDKSPVSLIPTIGIFLLALAVVEFANSIYRSRNHESWLVSTGVAVFDAVFSMLLLLVTDQDMTWQLIVISLYTVLRGIFELLIGFHTTVDPTDRFIWSLCGLAGIVFGIVIFNSGHLQNVDFVRFFGAYMLILGVCSLIYSFDNRKQQLEYRQGLSEAAKKARKDKTAVSGPKKSKTSKKA